MKPVIFQSKNELKDVKPYQLLIETFAIAAMTPNSSCLDLMNYVKEEYKEVLKVCNVEKIFSPEHGYTSPDGSLELSLLIKELEVQRLIKNGVEEEQARDLLEKTTCGVGNGVTGVLNNVLEAIKKIKNVKNPELILPTPSYPLIDSLGETKDITIVLSKSKSRNMLPTLEELQSKVTNKTIAIYLAYPNNPSFTTFEDKNKLKKIVSFCQENKIFLIADNIYQDMCFNKKHIEVFSVTNNAEYIVKLFGSSKDRPFFAGHRQGYFIGDNKLTEEYFNNCIQTHVCLSTQSKNMMSLDLLFRILELKNKKQLEVEDLDLLMPFLSGWMRSIDKNGLCNKINELQLYEKYQVANQYNLSKVKKNLLKAREHISKSSVLSLTSDSLIGNALFVKVNEEFYSGNELDLFEELLTKIGIAIYPGTTFCKDLSDKEICFRMTVIHEPIKNIIASLKKIENYLLTKRGDSNE